MKMKAAILALAAAGALHAPGGVELTEPADGAEVRLMHSALRRIISLPDRKARYDALAPERDKHSKKADPSSWRHPRAVALKWIASGGESAPWMVRISKSPSFEKYDEFVFEKGDLTSEKKKDGKVEWRCQLPSPNLELGSRYFWKVWSGVRCTDWGCGDTMIGASGPCGCGKTKPSVESRTFSFTTENVPPRFIDIEGRVKNIRDLGGWTAEGGSRVRQGMIYRGQGLNDNSKSGARRGRNRLTVEDVLYLTGRLGIRTDLDLRSGWETSRMNTSPLGAGVNFVHHSSESYGGIFTEKGKKVMAENFRLFCDRSNYPIYFHCIAGADRTGSLAYILNGLLGVSKHDLEVDWETTFYPKMHGVKPDKDGKRYWRSTEWFDEGLAAYGGADTPVRRKIELYLRDCGVTDEEMARFRRIMLERPGSDSDPRADGDSGEARP